MLEPKAIAVMVGLASLGVSLIGQTVAELPVEAIFGTGGLTLSGWLAATVWSAYKRWVKLTDLQTKVLEASLQRHRDEAEHRKAEAAHWTAEMEQNRSILDALRGVPRALAADHTPVASP